MKLWTAQYRYPGPYRLDITVKGRDNIGMMFAPTWDMVKQYKATGDAEAYTRVYHDMMTDAYQFNRQHWDNLLVRDYVVLVCFCAYGKFCHRHLLAQYLTQLGAENMGEITDFSPWDKRSTPIVEFQKEYRWLSNFWRSPFEYQGIYYRSVEHFYQAWKFPSDQRAIVAQCDKPKAEGRKAELPFNWESIKVEIMLAGLKEKFKIPVFKNKLKETGNRPLIEGNCWHDNFWGDCTCPKCNDVPGQNMLGKLLMQIRSEL